MSTRRRTLLELEYEMDQLEYEIERAKDVVAVLEEDMYLLNNEHLALWTDTYGVGS